MGGVVGAVGRVAGDASPAIAAILFAIAVFIWAIFVIRRLTRDEARARRRINELEVELNEAEAALAAEPNILMIWRGRAAEPERIAGDMRGTVAVPQDAALLLDFPRWLDGESAATLGEALVAMREAGRPFNIGVRSRAGELIEADGRTAGGLATLRLRPLAGERRDRTELAYDSRKLGKQVERLSAILDAAPFAIWLNDEGGRLIWVNRSYMSAVEAQDYDQVLARPILLASPAQIQFDVEKGHARWGRRGTSSAVIGGEKRALEIYEIPLTSGHASFAIDITLLDETKKELNRHIRAHASTLDKLQTAIAIFGQDQRLRFCNAAYAELWGLDAAWLETRPTDSEILDRLRELRRLPEQENFRDWRNRQLAAYNTLETRETWWHLPSGQTLRVIVEQHPFGGVTYLYDDVTEQIRLESQYRELIGVQRETVDNLHEGVALFGTDGKLKLFNPTFSRVWGLDAAALAKEPHIREVIAHCRQFHDDERIFDEIKIVTTSLDSGRRSLQGRLTRKDGVVLDYATVPLPDGNTLLTFVDVTASAGIEKALRERNEALIAADRLKTNFLSNVSYELRTPLTNIIGFAETMALGIAGELAPRQVEYLQHIRTSSRDLLSIIDAILDLTTIDAGAMELKLSAIDVGELLQATADAAAEAIERRDLTLNIEMAEDAANFVGDQKRVRQILANLLSNAVGFSDTGATIRMGARRDGHQVLLWVSDTGRGIDPEYQEKVFERFQAQPISGGHRGPGLGLSLVKSFVELHEGQVSLISRLGRGTTVICRFPIDGPGARRVATA
ncbi:MAG: ATP-binding protein [Aestuariivirgaceae bacterium]